MSNRVSTLIWGSVVRNNGDKFYLLKEEPESLYKNPKWQPVDTLRWLACSNEYRSVRNNEVEFGKKGDYDQVYKASYIIFGRDTIIEMIDDPQTSILVEYFSSEEDEVEGNPV